MSHIQCYPIVNSFYLQNSVLKEEKLINRKLCQNSDLIHDLDALCGTWQMSGDMKPHLKVRIKERQCTVE